MTRAFDTRRYPGVGATARLAFAFLYAPLAVVVVYSFNSGQIVSRWEGFSLFWYREVLDRDDVRDAVWVSLRVALAASAGGTAFALLAALGIVAMLRRGSGLAVKVAHTDEYRGGDICGPDSSRLGAAEEIDRAIMREGPETVAAVFLEPVQNSGGCYVPPDGYFQRVREICDTHGVLLVSDEVICGFGRLGHMFGADRFGYEPDMITMAKGLTSGYAPLGGVMIRDRIAEPFATAEQEFNHGFTFGGHPAAAAVALANLDILEGEDLPGRVRRHAAGFRARLTTLRDLPIVADLRGDGYFLALELRPGSLSDPGEARSHAIAVSKYLTKRMYGLGLTCRAAARGEEPVVQLSPPLTAGPDQFDEIVDALRVALIDAMEEFRA